MRHSKASAGTAMAMVTRLINVQVKVEAKAEGKATWLRACTARKGHLHHHLGLRTAART